MNISKQTSVSVDIPASLEALWKTLTGQHGVTVSSVTPVEADGSEYGISAGGELALAVTGQPLILELVFYVYTKSVREEGGLPRRREAELLSDTPAYVRSIVDVFVADGFKICASSSNDGKNYVAVARTSRDNSGGKVVASATLRW